jgi:predicted ATPase
MFEREFRLDIDSGRAWFEGRALPLKPAQFDLLRTLLARDDAAGTFDAGTVEGLNAALALCSARAGYVAQFADRAYALMPAAATRTPLLGREEALARVDGHVATHRLVTIVGAGGIGKTTLANAVAAQRLAQYPDGVCLVDMSALAEGRDLASALSTALSAVLDLPNGGAVTVQQVAHTLRGRRMLILLDSCERHLEVAALASEALLRAAPGIDVLATSREPLRAGGEWIVRLGPVALPPADSQCDHMQAAGYASVQIFVAHANAQGRGDFTLHGDNVGLVCALCRQLDGVPLALELAAALVGSIGLERLVGEASTRLLRPGAGRHASLSAMLDWSYDLLSPDEQNVLHRLAVFRGGFTLDAAAAVAADDDDGIPASADLVIELGAKSLVSMSAEGGPRHRLLDMTRDYVFAKLCASGELARTQERHARWLCGLMARFEVDWEAMPRRAWLDLYAPWIDDLLAAIDWALGAGNAPLLGAELAATGFSLADQVGAGREFTPWIERALSGPQAMMPTPPHLLLRLLSAYCDNRNPATYSLDAKIADAARALTLARSMNTTRHLAAPLLSLWGWPFVRGAYPTSLDAAERIAAIAADSADPIMALIGLRTRAQSLHFLGRHRESREAAMAALAGSDRRIPLAYTPSPVHLRTSMRIILARLLWMEGCAEQAARVAEEAVTWSQEDRPVAMCQALALASIPVAIWSGDMARAAAQTVRLRDRAERYGLVFWADWASRFEDALAVIHGLAAAPGCALADAPDRGTDMQRDHLGTFYPPLLTDDVEQRCAAGLVGWCAPEVLRVRGLRLLAADPVGAERLFRESLALAQEQGATAWALRSATSLAMLQLERNEPAQAHATLAPARAAVREGAATADVRAADALLARLPSH